MLTRAELSLLLNLVKHAWETGVVRGEDGAAQFIALRQRLEELLKAAEK